MRYFFGTGNWKVALLYNFGFKKLLSFQISRLLFLVGLGLVFAHGPSVYGHGDHGDHELGDHGQSAAAVVTGPYHVGLNFIDSVIDPAPEAYWPCIDGLPSSCNGFAPFELTSASSNFITQGGLVGWTEEDARRAVALAVDDVFRDLETNDPNQRVRINLYLGEASPSLGGQRLNVMLGQVSNPLNEVALLGTTGGSYDDPADNDAIAAAVYLHNIDALGDSYVTYDTPEKGN